jgi:hypothetical protein
MKERRLIMNTDITKQISLCNNRQGSNGNCLQSGRPHKRKHGPNHMEEFSQSINAFLEFRKI